MVYTTSLVQKDSDNQPVAGFQVHYQVGCHSFVELMEKSESKAEHTLGHRSITCT